MMTTNKMDLRRKVCEFIAENYNAYVMRVSVNTHTNEACVHLVYNATGRREVLMLELDASGVVDAAPVVYAEETLLVVGICKVFDDHEKARP